MSDTTAGRLLELLSLLQTRREWSGVDLAERLEIAERTVRRDVERLRGLGYPVESSRGRTGGYRLRSGTAMPPLLLDEGEATAIAVALRTAAGAGVTGVEENALRALVKLEQVLPGHLRRRVAAFEAATSTTAFGGAPQVSPDALTTIAVACRDHEDLRFGYRDRHDQATERTAEPQALVNAGRRWYLVAWDRDRADWRMFRLDRIEGLRSTGVRRPSRPLPGGDPAAFVKRQIEPAHRYEAVVTIDADAAEVRRLRWLGGTVEPLDDRTCRLRTSDADLEWLGLRIASIPFDFELHEPPELCDRLRDLGARLARATSAGAPVRAPPSDVGR